MTKSIKPVIFRDTMYWEWVNTFAPTALEIRRFKQCKLKGHQAVLKSTQKICCIKCGRERSIL